MYAALQPYIVGVHFIKGYGIFFVQYPAIFLGESTVKLYSLVRSVLTAVCTYSIRHGHIRQRIYGKEDIADADCLGVPSVLVEGMYLLGKEGNGEAFSLLPGIIEQVCFDSIQELSAREQIVQFFRFTLRQRRLRHPSGQEEETLKVTITIFVQRQLEVPFLVVSEILPFVVLANRSKSTFYKILYHETKF